MILLGNKEVDLLNDIFAGNPPDMEALRRVHELVSRDYLTRNPLSKDESA